MNNIGIPANADNKVVAGENAKVMTQEIFEEIVDIRVDCLMSDAAELAIENISESPIKEDARGNQWALWDTIDNETDYLHECLTDDCIDEYGINIDEWCEDNDINIDEIIREKMYEYVENNDKLCWFIIDWETTLGVFYKYAEDAEVDRWQSEYSDELKAICGDAKSVKELDIDACYQIDVIQSELLDTMLQKFGWHIDDMYDNYTIKYNEHLNFNEHFDAIYDRILTYFYGER